MPRYLFKINLKERIIDYLYLNPRWKLEVSTKQGIRIVRGRRKGVWLKDVYHILAKNISHAKKEALKVAWRRAA